MITTLVGPIVGTPVQNVLSATISQLVYEVKGDIYNNQYVFGEITFTVTQDSNEPPPVGLTTMVKFPIPIPSTFTSEYGTFGTFNDNSGLTGLIEIATEQELLFSYINTDGASANFVGQFIYRITS